MRKIYKASGSGLEVEEDDPCHQQGIRKELFFSKNVYQK